VTDRARAAAIPDPDYVAFTSAAYVADTDAAVEDAAADWLETQAGMPLLREVAQRTFELIGLGGGESVLDVGCGTGVLLPRLADAVGPTGRVTGLDRSSGFLARAHRRLVEAGIEDRVTLVRGDALALPFPNGSFDVVHVERVLMHLDDPDAAIRELARVARPGGRVVCAEVYATGVEFDHPDRPAINLVCEQSIAQIRNPSFGIELRRRMLHAGIEDVVMVGVVDVETVLPDEEVDDWRRKARDLDERGELELARATAAIDYLVAANEEGTYAGITILFVACGTVPASGVRQPA
jgi:ubiquinone/menaquinone biosynthesis C-methylase UbiE